MKIGQYIASRSDLVAPPIVRHLSRMLDANPPRPLSQTMRTLASELGERASAIESFDPTPLSTASIAQACTGGTHGLCPYHAYAPTEHTMHHACTAHPVRAAVRAPCAYRAHTTARTSARTPCPVPGPRGAAARRRQGRCQAAARGGGARDAAGHGALPRVTRTLTLTLTLTLALALTLTLTLILT